MKLLLDTNALLRLHLQSGKLGTKTKTKLEAANSIFFSPLSFYEILHKQVIPSHLVSDFLEATRSVGIQELPLSAEAVLEVRTFGEIRGRDPFDLMILSQARQAGLELLTSDMELLSLKLDFVKDATR